MSNMVDLLTSLDTFHELHVAADTRRAKIRVDAEALRHLLIDHTCMLNELQKHGVKARCPPPQRRRERIA